MEPNNSTKRDINKLEQFLREGFTDCCPQETFSNVCEPISGIYVKVELANRADRRIAKPKQLVYSCVESFFDSLEEILHKLTPEESLVCIVDHTVNHSTYTRRVRLSLV